MITATATDSTGNTSQFSNSPGFTTTTTATVVSAFVVTTDSDQLGSQTGLTSLRQAITNANADTSNNSADTISFAIGTGPATITVGATALPLINHPVILDGTTQPGYAGSPIITIDGGGLSGAVLEVIADINTIKGLEIDDFTGAGIEIDSSDNLVQSNAIQVAGSGATGVLVEHSDNTIGGSTAAAGNSISYGDGTTAVNSANASATTIQGNLLIATGTTGTAITSSGFQSPPALTSATSSGGVTTIDGGGTGTTSTSMPPTGRSVRRRSTWAAPRACRRP